MSIQENRYLAIGLMALFVGVLFVSLTSKETEENNEISEAKIKDSTDVCATDVGGYPDRFVEDVSEGILQSVEYISGETVFFVRESGQQELCASGLKIKTQSSQSLDDVPELSFMNILEKDDWNSSSAVTLSNGGRLMLANADSPTVGQQIFWKSDEAIDEYEFLLIENTLNAKTSPDPLRHASFIVSCPCSRVYTILYSGRISAQSLGK